MAKKQRPDFNLPSTKPAAAAEESKKTDWVYRSDADEVLSPVQPALPASYNEIVEKYARYAAGVGTIPLPFFDLVALTAVQVKMIAALAAHYHLNFDEQLAKSLIASAITSYGAAGFAYRAGRWMTRSIPLVGAIGNFVLLPWVAHSMTYSMGHLFAKHFEAGGTLLDFKPFKAST